MQTLLPTPFKGRTDVPLYPIEARDMEVAQIKWLALDRGESHEISKEYSRARLKAKKKAFSPKWRAWSYHGLGTDDLHSPDEEKYLTQFIENLKNFRAGNQNPDMNGNVQPPKYNGNLPNIPSVNTEGEVEWHFWVPCLYNPFSKSVQKKRKNRAKFSVTENPEIDMIETYDPETGVVTGKSLKKNVFWKDSLPYHRKHLEGKKSFFVIIPKEPNTRIRERIRRKIAAVFPAEDPYPNLLDAKVRPGLQMLRSPTNMGFCPIAYQEDLYVDLEDGWERELSSKLKKLWETATLEHATHFTHDDGVTPRETLWEMFDIVARHATTRLSKNVYGGAAHMSRVKIPWERDLECNVFGQGGGYISSTDSVTEISTRSAVFAFSNTVKLHPPAGQGKSSSRQNRSGQKRAGTQLSHPDRRCGFQNPI